MYRTGVVRRTWRPLTGLTFFVAGLALAAAWATGQSHPPAFAAGPCLGPCMRVGSASGTVGGLPLSVDITLEGVPLPGQIGYAFDLAYDDTALTRQATSTGTCIDGELTQPPLAVGPSPYSAKCRNLPEPGPPHADCSPGPCTLATVSFQCQKQGTFSLNLIDTTSYYEVSPGTVLLITNVDGAIECGPSVGTPVPTVIPTTPTPIPPVPCAAACMASSSGAGFVGGPPVAISVILENVPLPGQDGYAFDLDHSDTALTVLPASTRTCIDGMYWIFAVIPGPSPYFVACDNTPYPGALYTTCSPGPCLISTILLQCNTAGVFALDINDTTSYYAAGGPGPILIPNFDGVITCTLAPTATPVPPTSAATATASVTPIPPAQVVGGVAGWELPETPAPSLTALHSDSSVKTNDAMVSMLASVVVACITVAYIRRRWFR